MTLTRGLFPFFLPLFCCAIFAVFLLRACPAGFVSLSRSIGPEVFEPVEIAVFLLENVNDYVSVVKNDPEVVLHSLHTHRLQIEFLCKNDEIFKRTEDEHKLKHRKNEEKKPFSWFDSSRRIIKEKVDNRINQFKSNFIQIEKEKEQNELLTNDSYLMTPDKTIKESKYNEITIRKPLASAIYGSSFIKGKD